jgi:hypothetical protein
VMLFIQEVSYFVTQRDREGSKIVQILVASFLDAPLTGNLNFRTTLFCSLLSSSEVALCV